MSTALATDVKPSVKPSVHIAANTFVHTQCRLIGCITIGERCVVHPLATIDAGEGEIVLGEGNIVEEHAEIVNRIAGHTLEIGQSNIFKTGSMCYAKRVGSGNMLCEKCIVGERAELTIGCVIAPKCELLKTCTLQTGTLVAASGETRTLGCKPPSLEPHVQYLLNKMPKFGTALRSRT